MKLVAVTRILNEDDIVEALVRHHAGDIDHHLFLDNGSADRSVDILRALKEEGFKITLLQNKSSFFNESHYNSNLFQFSAREFGADWVLFLDADEFVDARGVPAGLRAHLESLGPEVNCLTIRSVQYFDMPTDDSSDLLVPRRLRKREAAPDGSVTKIFIRGRLAGYVDIDAGQHVALMKGQPIASRMDEQLWLAHYFRRSAYQHISKSVLGRLKVLAAGRHELAQNRASHYTALFETLRDAPEQCLRQPDWMTARHAGENLIEDPIHYAGGALRYTQHTDPPMKAIRTLLTYAEDLAKDFGYIIDTNEGVRLQATTMAARWSKIF